MEGRTVAMGSPVSIVVDDGEGSLTIEAQVTEPGPFKLVVSPTHWLGDHHPSIERFRWNLEVQGNQDPLAVEAWSREYIHAAVLALTEALWSVYKYETEVKDEGSGGDPPAGEFSPGDGG